ncbi:efflux RND transporter permease subunit [Terriglobus sp.]|uniref:efflux RND transporter permease subunit n=1 Tax=Terriglobus sp. TaxID=1889013 RepID=UPI003AFF8B0C
MNTDPQPGDTHPTERQRPGDAGKLNAGEGTRGPDKRAGDSAPQDRASAQGERKNATLAENQNGPIGGVHFSAPFIKRPVATFLLSIAIILAGAVAYRLLPVASLPEVEFPVISVGAGLPGADPETLASAVATPLERQFSRIAGVNQMTSTSSIGSCNITLQFDLNRNIDGAARDVQAAISAARAQLPANLPSNPTYRKINPADAPIMILALTSNTLTVPQLYDAADSILAQKLATVQGVGQTYVGGSSKPAVRLEANPQQLTSYNLSLNTLAAAAQTFNVLEPKGYLNGDQQRWSISTTDQLFGADAYRPLVVATSRGPVSTVTANNGLQANVASATTGATGGSSSNNAGNGSANGNGSSTSASSTGNVTSPGTGTSAATSTGSSAAVSSFGSNVTAPNTAAINSGAGYTSAAINTNASNVATTSIPAAGIVRVGDVAQVVNSVEDIHTFGMFNGHPSILIIVFKSPGANVIQTVDNIEKQLPALQASIPPSIKLQVALDRTVTIRASVRDITRTMMITIVLVILVVFFFLRELRSTLIPSVSVPLSLLGTFGVMYLLGYTLDNLSLMALTISTGFVVDDAIVVIENISRHLEEGMSPYEAAMLGSKEIGFTVLSMSISLIAVFIPILLMGGIVGRLFREFAVTLSVAILMSLMVSLTTTPMLSARFLKAHKDIQHGRLYRWSEKFFDFINMEYEHGLSWVLRHQLPVLLITIGTFLLNIYLFVLVPKGFFPQQDTGRMGGRIQGQQDVSFDSMKVKVEQMTETVKRDPAVLNVMSSVGGGGPGGGASNSGNMFIFLKDPKDRKGQSAEMVIARLRPKLSSVPGVITYLQSSQELNIGGRGSATQYQYTLTADSVSNLNEWAPKMMAAMQQEPDLRDIATDQQDKGLRAQLVIDRNTASRLGISALSIDQTLSAAFGQRQVSTTYKPLNQYHVVLEVAPEWQQSPDALKTVYVKSSTGAQVPLSAISHFEEQRIPLQVNHQGLSPAATLSFNLPPGVSLSQATAAIEHARNSIGMPASIAGGFQGTAAAFKDSLSSEPILILLALTAVYIVLGILYESFIHPLTILSTLPSAGVGALVALLVTQVDLSVIAMIGIVLLIGIVKKNAIMMIDFALVAEREHGKSPRDAIYEACLLRFRPIMMTTMAALLGAVPLAFGTGTGSELRRPLGITIVGGLLVSQCLTLFTTPVVYLYMDRLRGFLSRVLSKQAQPQKEPYAYPQPVAGD